LRDFFENIIHAREVQLGIFQSRLCQSLLGLEFRDPCGFFNNGAAVGRTAAQDLSYAPLLDQCIRLRPQACAHEQFLDVTQAAQLSIQQIFAVSRSEQPSRDHDLARAKLLLVEFPPPDLQNNLRTNDIVRTLDNPWAGIFAPEAIFARRHLLYFLGYSLLNYSGLSFFYQSLRFFRRLGSHFSLVPVLRGFGHVILDYDFGRLAGIRTLIDFGIEQRQRHFCHARGLAVASAGEDHIFHACAAQRLGGLLPQYPRDGIRDIGLAAAIWSNDGCHTVTVKLQLGAVAE